MSDDPWPGARPSQAPFSDNLNRTFRRAVSIAEERRHGVMTSAHLLLALIDDPDAACAIAACDVDLDALRLALSSLLSRQATGGAAPNPDAAVQAIMRRVVAHIESVGKTSEINGAHVLAAMLMSAPAQPTAQFLYDAGMTRFDALRYISHGLRKRDAVPVADEPPAGTAVLAVKLLNDDYTPMEFVVEVLQHVFDHDRETATTTMMRAHSDGACRCGIYPADIARAKAAQVTDLARAEEHPLCCVVEPAEASGSSPERREQH